MYFTVLINLVKRWFLNFSEAVWIRRSIRFSSVGNFPFNCLVCFVGWSAALHFWKASNPFKDAWKKIFLAVVFVFLKRLKEAFNENEGKKKNRSIFVHHSLWGNNYCQAATLAKLVTTWQREVFHKRSCQIDNTDPFFGFLKSGLWSLSQQVKL